MTSSKNCKNNLEAGNVVLIDEERDSFNNANTEIPKNLEKKPQFSNRLKSDNIFPEKTYIYIDDDDESPEVTDFAPKNLPSVKLSMRKRTYPSFRLQPDAVDCEIMVDSPGTLQKLWKKASSKRNINVETDKCEETPFASNEVVFKPSDIDGVTVEGLIVNEKEKVKETDEYKQAVEEELLARQRALKIQAEEAQQERRLLKRKKAEELRLLDIENRQKQRVEEIRESQKQDEENMNLKEIYRTEVQTKLKKLEMHCHDMASLLRGLGILVDKNPYASSIQVHAAYKRALLSFHPDRASGFDMRQQVEAEEKFKLISRMKDKVCNTPTLK